MADATAEFFDRLAARGHEPLLEKAAGTLRFELADDGRRDTWLVTVAKGDVSVSRKDGAADCVVRADRELFDAIAAGEVNAMAALLRGAVAVDGDPEMLVRFQRLFPVSASRRVPGGRPSGSGRP
jgi:putative sterol carrier protein